MGIDYQYGFAPTAQLAKATGEQAHARELAQQATQRAHQQAMAAADAAQRLAAEGRARQWELQKMEYNSQQDFAFEKMREEAIFKRDLAKEIQQKDEMESKVKAIQNTDYLSDEDKELAIIQLQTKIPTYTQKSISD